MKKLMLVIMLAVLITSCQTLDNTLYKYGNGIKHAISGATNALACVAVSPVVCATVGATKGYIEGKQEARKKIAADKNTKLVKSMADKQAKDMGVKIDTCWFWCD